jgi:hypothetical protein
VQLGKYSMGIGDRFGHQGKAQLAALKRANEAGVKITPVWNKSYREHQIIGTHPDDVRETADAAVAAMAWQDSYFVDADHVNLNSVDLFLEASDFFTLDVAEYIGEKARDENIRSFIERRARLLGELVIHDIEEPLHITERLIEEIAVKYLFAIQEAGRIYRHLAKKKAIPFIVEVSLDETETPQTPVELLFVLSAIADENIPVQTIAPKFSGRFNKGVDYVGDTDLFTREFRCDLAVIGYARETFDLPESLKLSVHSGSDKFAIYGPIRDALKDFDAGLHLKTAGTTWLEEVIGLAEAGGDGLAIARDIYAEAYARLDELIKPYATVIDIDASRLPVPEDVFHWDSQAFVSKLRHDQGNVAYNRYFRQLLHIGYKIAAEMGDRFLQALVKHEAVIHNNVTDNLYKRHIVPLFF